MVLTGLELGGDGRLLLTHVAFSRTLVDNFPLGRTEAPRHGEESHLLVDRTNSEHIDPAPSPCGWKAWSRPTARRVVDGVSFYVDHDEIVGLLGPNGAGKTTSFRMTCGMIEPDAGKVCSTAST